MAALPARRGGQTPTVINPSREFEDIYDRMGQVMNFAFGLAPAALADLPWVPTADLSETDDAYVAQVDLPAVNKDQVEVQIQDRELIVSGEITEPGTAAAAPPAPQHAPHRPVRVPHLPARRRQGRRGHRAALRRGPDGDRAEVRGRQAAQDRDHRLTNQVPACSRIGRGTPGARGARPGSVGP